ncbi:hypothetical protein BBD42_05835 [Paenibacillus sp. BIHB 4019]|uniref:Uncharacterized protein n=1 Tax=Paenibacillus sp. BIHB 4019 TaxID=1870819 RepID=A0A1B2DE91_9BACL|nr:hypothetical protein BBD42_05835 [Paenibacillus sp. BIHB 4019]
MLRVKWKMEFVIGIITGIMYTNHRRGQFGLLLVEKVIAKGFYLEFLFLNLKMSQYKLRCCLEVSPRAIASCTSLNAMTGCEQVTCHSPLYVS